MERRQYARARRACGLPYRGALHCGARCWRLLLLSPRSRSIPPRPQRTMPLLNGMHSAASALRYWERKQEVVANNLANVSSNGFKAQRVFATLLDGILPGAETSSDLSTGALRQTANPTDLAIDGQGFFVVSTS